MRERINRLAKGIIDTELPKLFYTPRTVEETVGGNTVYKREIYLTSENNLHIKGLAYSSHERVKIINNAYGGTRNHITYEIDTAHCENGDTIKGSVFLITNSGEVEVPFVFHVEMIASVKVLSQLKNVEDYVELAGRDMEMALRLMEYRDFTEAPFLQDMHARTVYEGVKGHGNRQNALEEFFLALGVKDPIELTLQAAKKTYDNPTEVLTDKVVLKKNTWGYIYIEVKSDGPFIELSKKVITQADFVDGRFDLLFKIHPERMHGGKNLGSIRLVTAHGETAVAIEAVGDTTVDITGREHEISKAGICRYVKLLVEFIKDADGRGETLKKMQKELDAIRGVSGSSALLSLFQAEVYLESGRKDQACLILDECGDEILSARERQALSYCYFQYLRTRTNDDPEQKESLKRLIRRHLDEGTGNFYFYMILMKLEPELGEDAAELFHILREQYKNGCHSPFLYLEACRVLAEQPELLKSIGGFEIHVLYFGAKNDMIPEELAAQAARLTPEVKFYHRLHYRALAALYEKRRDKELLAAVCCLLIKGNCRSEKCFSWYEKGVEEEISLTRLYEYYLYSLPKEFEKPLPKQVVLYFSFETTSLDRHSRSVLYKNILTYLKPDSELYRAYGRQIEQFAMEQMFQSRINSRLAVIYKHMIYRDIIDGQVAKVLPAILKSNRIVCGDEAMKYVVVLNEMMAGEDAYPIKDGVAYVPIFFDNSVILFQDTYGNRYMDVDYTKEPVLTEPELEEKCFEMDPEHPMLRARACHEIMEKEQVTGDEVLVLQKALEELPLKPLYQEKMMGRIVEYYKAQMGGEGGAMAQQGCQYLLRLNKKKLSRKERAAVCETLIGQNYEREAFEILREYGPEEIHAGYLQKLCDNMILQKLFGEDDTLLSLAYRTFSMGKGDSVILDYLCEHYNGTNEQMYRILVQAVRDHVETYDMEERLLAQLLFTGSDRHLDTVFDFYAGRKKTNENIVKAYFTVKCAGYFLKDLVPGDKVFAYLEGALNSSGDLTKVPDIYLLALSKFYAGLPSLSKEQETLCGRVMAVLRKSGVMFAHFKKLAPYVETPGELLDKEIIEYHGSADRIPKLLVRILPDEEEFHEEDMQMVYKGIYIRRKVLFEGEILEYRICEEESGRDVVKKEGEIACAEVPAGDRGNRFACLNELTLYLGTRDDEKLRDKMRDYLIDDLTVEMLFPLQ